MQISFLHWLVGVQVTPWHWLSVELQYPRVSQSVARASPTNGPTIKVARSNQTQRGTAFSRRCFPIRDSSFVTSLPIGSRLQLWQRLDCSSARTLALECH